METSTQTVFITGGAGGIGSAIGHCFSHFGHHVYLLDNNPNVVHVAQEIKKNYGKPTYAFVADVAKEHELIKAARSCIDTSERKHFVVINCAGISVKGADGLATTPHNMSTKQWELVHNVNLRAPFILCREFLPVMMERRFGRIINISSRAARTYVSTVGIDYHSSKTALTGLTRALAGDYGKYGITVNAIAPGRISSPMTDNANQQLLKSTLDDIPLKRFGEPSDIGNVAVFLASNAAAYINGAIIDVNGGIYMT